GRRHGEPAGGKDPKNARLLPAGYSICGHQQGRQKQEGKSADIPQKRQGKTAGNRERHHRVKEGECSRTPQPPVSTHLHPYPQSMPCSENTKVTRLNVSITEVSPPRRMPADLFRRIRTSTSWHTGLS